MDWAAFWAFFPQTHRRPERCIPLLTTRRWILILFSTTQTQVHRSLNMSVVIMYFSESNPRRSFHSWIVVITSVIEKGLRRKLFRLSCWNRSKIVQVKNETKMKELCFFLHSSVIAETLSGSPRFLAWLVTNICMYVPRNIFIVVHFKCLRTNASFLTNT
jgi:hypothetical protein